jgi:hypothetical protein
MEIVLEGRQGKSAIVKDNILIIVKKGKIFTAQREMILPIKDITSVRVMKPEKLLAGFIQFSTIARRQEDTELLWYLTGVFDAVKDENSVVFDGNEKYELALKIKNHILELNPLVLSQ